MKNRYKDNTLGTISGKRVHIMNPLREEITIEDIAYALSHVARYNGHTKMRYTVGQHVIMVCKELKARGYSPMTQLFGLLHDASEAYIVDMPTPIKVMLPDYLKLEKNFQDRMYEYLVGRVPTDEEFSAFDQVDRDALYTEAMVLVPSNGWITHVPYMHITLDQTLLMTAKEVRDEIMNLYNKLTVEVMA